MIPCMQRCVDQALSSLMLQANPSSILESTNPVLDACTSVARTQRLKSFFQLEQMVGVWTCLLLMETAWRMSAHHLRMTA